MALLSPDASLECFSAVEARLFLLFHTSELSERFQGTLHVGKVVQTVTIDKISQVGKLLCCTSFRMAIFMTHFLLIYFYWLIFNEFIKRVKTGQWTTVTFKFLRNPEFVRVGTKIFFRQGRTRAMGSILRTFPFEVNVERWILQLKQGEEFSDVSRYNFKEKFVCVCLTIYNNNGQGKR